MSPREPWAELTYPQRAPRFASAIALLYILLWFLDVFFRCCAFSVDHHERRFRVDHDESCESCRYRGQNAQCDCGMQYLEGLRSCEENLTQAGSSAGRREVFVVDRTESSGWVSRGTFREGNRQKMGASMRHARRKLRNSRTISAPFLQA